MSSAPTLGSTYQPKEWETVPCPICNSTAFTVHERYGCDLQFTYVTCRTCKNIYQSPRPKYDADFLKAAYGNYYLFEHNHVYQDSQYNDFKEEVAEIVTYDTSKESILDVGCAMGDFLYQAKKVYHRVFGVEIAENMAAHTASALQVRVFSEQFETLDTTERFSCIHMSHIIEHVPNPVAWIEKAKLILKPDGLLVLCVPNMHSLTRVLKLALKRAGLRRGRWNNRMRTPDHLLEPTVAGMRYFMEQSGMEVLDLYSYSRSRMTSQGVYAYLFHRIFKLGSNLRVYARLRRS